MNTAPDPEDLEITDDGAVQEVVEDWAGKPTEDELLADRNLFPGDDSDNPADVVADPMPAEDTE